MPSVTIGGRPFADLTSLLLVGAVMICSGCASWTGEKGGGGLVPFAPAGATDKASQNRYALVVGIDDFEDPSFNDLKFAEKDAHTFAEALSEYDDVTVLTSPEETTRTSILRALRDLHTRARGARDTVVVYISSHGTLARRPGGRLQRYVVSRDTVMDAVPETGIVLDELVAALEAMSPRRKALILAMCHTGTGKSTLSDDLAEVLTSMKGPTFPALDEVSEALVVVSASAFGEAAREDANLQHDIYTFFLLEALSKGDRNQDGAITISEAHDYARSRTYEYTSGGQRPTAESRILGSDPIVLGGERKQVGKAVLYSYDRSAEGIKVIVNGQEKGVLPGGAAVPSGDLELRLEDARSGNVLFNDTVGVEAGANVDLVEVLRDRNATGLHLLGGMMVPLSSNVRRGFIPSSQAISAMVSHQLSWGPTFAAQLSYMWAEGRAGDRQFDFGAGEGGLVAGWTFPMSYRLDLRVLAGGAFLWAFRDFDDRDETLGGWDTRLVSEVHYDLDYLSVVIQLGGGLLVADLGDRVVHPHGLGQLGLGWTF